MRLVYQTLSVLKERYSQIWPKLQSLFVLFSLKKSHLVCQSAIHEITKNEEGGTRRITVSEETGCPKIKMPAKRDEHHLLSLQYEGGSLLHSSFSQHSALLSSFPTKQKLPRFSQESSTEPYWRLCNVTMETFPWHSPLQKETLTHDFWKKLLGEQISTPLSKKPQQLSILNLNPLWGVLIGCCWLKPFKTITKKRSNF